jgi:hypothetical protein
MKLKNLLLPTLVSAAALGSAPLAHAQFAGYQSGDLIIALWANNYDTVNFDLGSLGQFSQTASFTVSDFNAGVVESALGASTLDGVSFNLGADGSSTPYVTDTINPNYLSGFGRTGVATSINTYGNNVLGSAGANNYSTFAPGNTDAYDHNSSISYEAEWGAAGLTEGTVYTTLAGSVGGSSTTGSATINFYEIGNDTSTLLGDFTLNDTGTLTFAGADAAVPESSTWGVLSGLGLLAMALRGRLAQTNI